MNNPHNLDQPAEWAGIWWLPESPDEKVPGVLHYDAKGGLILSLIGGFEERVITRSYPNASTPVKLFII